MANRHGRVKAHGCITASMTKPDDDRLAEALRANLKRRKVRMRAQQASDQPIESFGADEEGEAPVSTGIDRPGAWVHIDDDGK